LNDKTLPLVGHGAASLIVFLESWIAAEVVAPQNLLPKPGRDGGHDVSTHAWSL
jgi:hypothetical protein